MLDLTPGMHDIPSLYPHLPAKQPEDIDGGLAGQVITTALDSPWRTCWEYVLTHELTDRERSAFWHGANLVFRAAQS